MRAHPTEHYEQVAEVYDEAIEAGDPPTQAVADAFGVPYTTAARWVRRARALELLPPPRPGLPLGNVDTDHNRLNA
jgi:transposase